MKYSRSWAFKEAYEALPQHIKDKAEKAFELFQSNRGHPSLQIKKMKGVFNIWEGRIDDFYRFTFEYVKDHETGGTMCLFRNIGRHDILDHAP